MLYYYICNMLFQISTLFVRFLRKVKQQIEFLLVESYDQVKQTKGYTGIVLKGESI